MPAPVRCEHQIARSHRNPLAIDNGVPTLSFDDQPQRCRRMAMRPRNLARLYDLDVGHERVAGDPGKLGVGEAQDPAFGLRGTYQFGGPHRLRAQVAPVPEIRHGSALRLDAYAAANPSWRHMLRAQLLVIAVQFFLRRLDIRELQHWRSSL